jgi:hypothetical protein
MKENKKQIGWVFTFICAGITAGGVTIIMHIAKSYVSFLQDRSLFGAVVGLLIGGIIVATFKFKIWLDSKKKNSTEQMK